MEERLSKLKAGDEVLLSGGLYATIDRVEDKNIYMKLGSNRGQGPPQRGGGPGQRTRSRAELILDSVLMPRAGVRSPALLA